MPRHGIGVEGYSGWSDVYQRRDVIPPGMQQRTHSVDKLSGQWIVRDPKGEFWLPPSVKDAGDERVPYEPAEEMDLERIPGHHQDTLGLRNCMNGR